VPDAGAGLDLYIAPHFMPSEFLVDD